MEYRQVIDTVCEVIIFRNSRAWFCEVLSCVSELVGK